MTGGRARGANAGGGLSRSPGGFASAAAAGFDSGGGLSRSPGGFGSGVGRTPTPAGLVATGVATYVATNSNRQLTNLIH